MFGNKIIWFSMETDVASPQKSFAAVSPSQVLNFEKNQSTDDDAGAATSPRPKTIEPVACQSLTSLPCSLQKMKILFC